MLLIIYILILNFIKLIVIYTLYRRKAYGVQELFHEAHDLDLLKGHGPLINQMTKFLGDIIGG